MQTLPHERTQWRPRAGGDEPAVKVLLVDDSRRLQRSISTSLRKAFFAVDMIADGAEALWYATHHSYDVMVLDLMLPNLDGLSLIRQLRQAPPPHRDIH